MKYELFHRQVNSRNAAYQKIIDLGLKEEEEAIMRGTSSSINTKLEFKIKHVSKVKKDTGSDAAKFSCAKVKYKKRNVVRFSLS